MGYSIQLQPLFIVTQSRANKRKIEDMNVSVDELVTHGKWRQHGKLMHYEKLFVQSTTLEKLYPHQVEGLVWLYDSYEDPERNGVIVADEMGLGKTVLAVAFVDAMLLAGNLNRALVWLYF